MAFSEELVREAWKRSGERCECKRESHGHRSGRCGRSLLWTMRGAEGAAGWQACRLTSWGTDVLSNCAILCAACQKPKPPQPVRVRGEGLLYNSL
ncbi:MAG TPA: hypothetical protein VFB30_22065, partial [Spirochaetia bacterium]|nr:hypothetical protein [Spirochaetia bacterium]